MPTGALLKTVHWVRTIEPNTAIEIEDAMTIKINKSTDIQNNICELTLKNPAINYDGNYVYGRYVEPSSYELKFKEEDEITVWAKYTDDADDITNGGWKSSVNLLGNFIVEEYSMDSDNATTQVRLKSVDAAYLLFNKVHSYSYGINEKFTAPGIIRDISRQYTEATPGSITTESGTQNDSGVKYTASAKFVSEGGNIKDYRTVSDGGPTTQLNGQLTAGATTITVDSTTGFKSAGTLVIGTEHLLYTGTNSTQFTGVTRGIDNTTDQTHSDNTDVYQGFPEVVISKQFKPIFEWFGDIANTYYTNYESEIQEGGTPFYDRAFIIWLDENNSVNWINADDTVDLIIDLGDTEYRSTKLSKSVFDSVNYVIYNCGEDMYGNGILYYWYDQTTNVASMKMRYQPMTEITNSMINDDIQNYNSTRDTSVTQDTLRQFPDSGEYPISIWAFKTESNLFRALNGDSARTTLTSDSDYNSSLREAAKYRGLLEAQSITKKTAGLRYKGQIAIRSESIIRPGDLIQTTNRLTGVNGQKLRVISVTYNINGNTFETTAEVEEDEKVIA